VNRAHASWLARCLVDRVGAVRADTFGGAGGARTHDRRIMSPLL
jgi:hypothetical protein